MKLPLLAHSPRAGLNGAFLLAAAIVLSLTTGCPGRTAGQEGGAKAEAKAGDAPGGKPLPALSAKADHLIGRAVFEDGRPIPEFEVAFEGGFGGGSEGEGRNGQYDVKNQDPASIIVRYAHAKIHVPYLGKNYLLPLAPTDNKPDNKSEEEWRADIQKGAVRDFVFRLTGTQPGHAVMDPAAVADSDASDVKNGFWGQTVRVVLDTPVAQVGKTVEITLAPDGPLIDGSTGKTVVRALHLKQPGSYYYLYDLPLGTYTTTARLVAADGAATPLHLKEQVIEDPQPSGDTPQASVKLTWTFDSHYQFLNNPLLTISE